MIKFLLDIAPYPREGYHQPTRPIANDTIDTIAGYSNRVADSVSTHSHTPWIIGALVAGLVALGILLLMVRAYRKKVEASLAMAKA